MTTHCPSCGDRTEIDASERGKVYKCSKCGELHRIGEDDEHPALDCRIAPVGKHTDSLGRKVVCECGCEDLQLKSSDTMSREGISVSVNKVYTCPLCHRDILKPYRTYVEIHDRGGAHPRESRMNIGSDTRAGDRHDQARSADNESDGSSWEVWVAVGKEVRCIQLDKKTSVAALCHEYGARDAWREVEDSLPRYIIIDFDHTFEYAGTDYQKVLRVLFMLRGMLQGKGGELYFLNSPKHLKDEKFIYHPYSDEAYDIHSTFGEEFNFVSCKEEAFESIANRNRAMIDGFRRDKDTASLYNILSQSELYHPHVLSEAFNAMEAINNGPALIGCLVQVVLECPDHSIRTRALTSCMKILEKPEIPLHSIDKLSSAVAILLTSRRIHRHAKAQMVTLVKRHSVLMNPLNTHLRTLPPNAFKEDIEILVPVLTELKGYYAADLIIKHLFSCPTERRDYQEGIHAGYFGQYADIIMEAVTYTRVSQSPEHSGGGCRYEYCSNEVVKAVQELHKHRSQLPFNLLHEIRRIQDVSIIPDDLGPQHNQYIDRSAVRDAARKALEVLGNPSYEPSIYNDERVWAQSENQ